MEQLIIKKTKYTPQIELNAQNGLLCLSGKSYPENSFEFYAPVIEWIENYFNNYSQFKTTINFQIVYINGDSSKLFFDIFDLVDELVNKDKYVEINWLYDENNERAKEVGKIFKDDFQNLSFNLKKDSANNSI